MILEPTDWSAQCDLMECSTKVHSEERVDDIADFRVELRERGWVDVHVAIYCSLNCLLRDRHSVMIRRWHSSYAAVHAKWWHHGQRCCPDHGKHKSDGSHTRICPARYPRR